MGASMNTYDIGANRPLDPPEPPLPPAPEVGALGHVASQASHSLNDIITIIQGYATMLEDSHDASDARRQDAMQIRFAAERATHLTSQLLLLGPSGVSPVPADHGPQPARTRRPAPVLFGDD